MTAHLIRNTGGPVAAENELDQRIREWCAALGLTLGGDDNIVETPA